MKYLFGLFLIIGCTKVPTLPTFDVFHFRDKVRITGGFYGGCHGKVMEKVNTNLYIIYLKECSNTIIVESISNLELEQ